MPTILYDLEVDVASAIPFDGISREEKNALLKKPLVSSTKPKQAGAIIRAEAPTEASALDDLTLEEIGEGYKELINRTNNFLDLLEDRVGEHTLFIDPNQQPALASTVASLYQGVSDRITFSMYLSALRLEKNISVAVGESEIGDI